jgi:hypothetical protein
VVKGGVAIGDKVSATGAVSLNVLDGIVRICENAASTSTTTGALIVGGGVGISGAAYFGSTANFAGEVTFAGGSHFPSNSLLTFGGADSTAHKMAIYHDAASGANNSIVRSADDAADLYLQSNARVIIGDKDNTQQGLVFNKGGSTSLYYGGVASSKLDTLPTGIKITGNLDVTGDITAYSTSDARLKNDVKPIQDSLAKVKSISGNTFTWNEASKKEGQEDTGVIAQEISAIGLPGTVIIREDGTYAVDYEKLVPLLLEAIKELSNKVDTLS